MLKSDQVTVVKVSTKLVNDCHHSDTKLELWYLLDNIHKDLMFVR